MPNIKITVPDIGTYTAEIFNATTGVSLASGVAIKTGQPSAAPVPPLTNDEYRFYAMYPEQWNFYGANSATPIFDPLKIPRLSSAPTVGVGKTVIWAANFTGTKDGQSFARGDVLLTSNVYGYSKTIRLMQYSAV